MADNADLAQIEIDANALRARLTVQAAPQLVATGRCQNCDQALARVGQLFCDQECEKDFHKRELAHARLSREW
jgi:predicted acetyltransferase